MSYPTDLGENGRVMNQVFIVSAVRTAIGSFGGALRDIEPRSLAAAVAREAIRRSGVDPGAIGHSIFGQVIPTGPQDAYLARAAAIDAGVPVEVPAMGVNRLCGSGLQAILSAAQAIALGDCETALAGGAEVMSRAPFLLTNMRFGKRMGDDQVIDGLTGALTDPFGRVHMGVTADNVAERCGISREEQDKWALLSHQRAAAAIADGRFVDQILPIEVWRGRKTEMFATDEHVRSDTTLDSLAALRAIFRDGGSVTAGNASGINDGAAAVVLASEDALRRRDLKPLARIVSYGHAGVDPALMGLGPIPATRSALKRAGLKVADLDLIESNEAFAAQVCAVSDELGFDPDKVNPNGSGIALGHPVGATGAILTVKALYELQRTGARRALVTMCIGGGQGIAAVLERV